jgi:hypothetical protein
MRPDATKLNLPKSALRGHTTSKHKFLALPKAARVRVCRKPQREFNERIDYDEYIYYDEEIDYDDYTLSNGELDDDDEDYFIHDQASNKQVGTLARVIERRSSRLQRKHRPANCGNAKHFSDDSCNVDVNLSSVTLVLGKDMTGGLLGKDIRLTRLKNSGPYEDTYAAVHLSKPAHYDVRILFSRGLPYQLKKACRRHYLKCQFEPGFLKAWELQDGIRALVFESPLVNDQPPLSLQKESMNKRRKNASAGAGAGDQYYHSASIDDRYHDASFDSTVQQTLSRKETEDQIQECYREWAKEARELEDGMRRTIPTTTERLGKQTLIWHEAQLDNLQRDVADRYSRMINQLKARLKEASQETPGKMRTSLDVNALENGDRIEYRGEATRESNMFDITFGVSNVTIVVKKQVRKPSATKRQKTIKIDAASTTSEKEQTKPKGPKTRKAEIPKRAILSKTQQNGMSGAAVPLKGEETKPGNLAKPTNDVWKGTDRQSKQILADNISAATSIPAANSIPAATSIPDVTSIPAALIPKQDTKPGRTEISFLAQESPNSGSGMSYSSPATPHMNYGGEMDDGLKNTSHGETEFRKLDR